MQTIDMDGDELFVLIKRAVREVIQEEMGRIWLEGPPVVNDEEQEDINLVYGKPDRRKQAESRESVDIWNGKSAFRGKRKSFFFKRENLRSETIGEIVNFLKRLRGESVSVDVKKLKGDWQGFYRIKKGKVRIIFELSF